MIKNLLRPAMIFVPLGLGMFFPQAACTSFLIRWLLMIMLLMVFLGLSIRDMKLRKSHFIVLLVNLIIGVSCYFAVKFITGDDTLAKAAFFVGITPTATAAAVLELAHAILLAESFLHGAPILHNPGAHVNAIPARKCRRRSVKSKATPKSAPKMLRKESIFLLLRLFLSLYRVFSHFHLLQAGRGVTLPVFLIEER